MPPTLLDTVDVDSQFEQLGYDPEEIARNLAHAIGDIYAPHVIQGTITERRVGITDLYIKTKNRRLCPLVPNEIQQRYLDTLYNGRVSLVHDPSLPSTNQGQKEIKLDWRKSLLGLKGVKEIILKGRQFGLSTLILAIYFIDTISTPHTNTVVVAHDLETTERLFRTVQRFYENLPPSLQPHKRIGNKREYVWDEIDSSFYVGTAGNVNFGRANTINNVHCTEVPLWPDAGELMTGLIESVPEDGNIFIESTAKGLGNWYHQEWKNATLPVPKSEFTPRFFFWGDHSEYRVTTPSIMEKYLQDPLDEEELELKEKFGLDDQQLAWRRGKIRIHGDKFRQEYPSTPDEAFLVTGATYFNNQKLSSISKTLLSTEWDPIPPTTLLSFIPTRFPTLRSEKNALLVWEYPQPGKQYVVSADPAEGLRDWGEHDFGPADVFEAGTWTQVAQLYGQWDAFTFAKLLHNLAWWYNFALLGVESNNHGHAVLGHLIHELAYPPMDDSGWGGLYYHESFDEKKKVKRRKPGFPTTPKSKYENLDGLAAAIEHDEIHFRSRRSISELMTFVKKDGGKAGAEGNSHDDTVTTAAIARALLAVRHSYLLQPNAVAGTRSPLLQEAVAGSTAGRLTIPQVSVNASLGYGMGIEEGQEAPAPIVTGSEYSAG
jgi:hypothetical protein